MQRRGFLIGAMAVESAEAFRAVGIGSDKRSVPQSLVRGCCNHEEHTLSDAEAGTLPVSLPLTVLALRKKVQVDGSNTESL